MQPASPVAKPETLFGTLTLPRLPVCGHKFTPGGEPRHRNCQSCWFGFFIQHADVTTTADELYAEHGEYGLREVKGRKFTNHYLAFREARHKWAEPIYQVKEENE